jgi:ElaB/YqjD/DUF883 family membrane-anchored ribosome-binding protein
MTHYSTTERSGASDWILGTIKRNPEGLLLLAAGAALLMRSSSSSRRIGSEFRHYDRHVDPASRHAASKTADGEGANPDHGAREYLSDVAETASDTAKSYASAVADYADDAVQNVSDQSRRLVRQAQSGLDATTEYLLEEQPVAVAIIGLAAGAAVAAAFPPTEVERRALGSTGEQLRDAAGKVTDRLKEAGSQAGERLMSVAEERGWNKEGLKEVAEDVGGTFTAAIKGEESSGEIHRKSETSEEQAQKSRGGQTPRFSQTPPSKPNASAKRGQR